MILNRRRTGFQSRRLMPSNKTSVRTPSKNPEIKPTINEGITILGPISIEDGLGQISINIYESIKDLVNTNLFPTHIPLTQVDLPIASRNILNRVLLTTGYLVPDGDTLLSIESLSHLKKIGHKLVALSMLECDKIPQSWVDKLNRFYNLCLVPSEFLIDVYKKSGVNIPVRKYHLPLPQIAKDLESPPLYFPKDLFTFGILAGGWPKKGQVETIKAFKKAFPGNNSVRLKIHIRFGYKDYIDKILSEALNDNRISITQGIISKEQTEEWVRSIDCGLLISSGEGFSIVPREFLAKGIPVIVSSGHAHTEVVQEGGIPISIKDKGAVYYNEGFGKLEAQDWKPNWAEVPSILKEVYNNIESYRDNLVTKKHLLNKYVGNLWANPFLELLQINNILPIIQKENLSEKPLLFVVAPWLPLENSVAGGANTLYETTKLLEETYDIKWITWNKTTVEFEDRACFSIELLDAIDRWSPVEITTTKEFQSLISIYSPKTIFSTYWWIAKELEKVLDRTPRIKHYLYSEHIGFAAGENGMAKNYSDFAKICYKAQLKQKTDELNLYKKVDLIFTISEQDRQYIKKELPNISPYTLGIPNPPSDYLYNYETTNKDIIFLGGTWHRGNIDAMSWFCQEVAPLIQKQVPDFRLDITGMPDDYARYALALLLQKYPVLRDQGYIKDIDQFIAHRAGTICPVQNGSGLKTKAMTAAKTLTPCIITEFTANEIGINKDKLSPIITRSAQEMADKIILLMNDINYRKQASKTMEIIRDYSCAEYQRRRLKFILKQNHIKKSYIFLDRVDQKIVEESDDSIELVSKGFGFTDKRIIPLDDYPLDEIKRMCGGKEVIVVGESDIKNNPVLIASANCLTIPIKDISTHQLFQMRSDSLRRLLSGEECIAPYKELEEYMLASAISPFPRKLSAWCDFFLWSSMVDETTVAIDFHGWPFGPNIAYKDCLYPDKVDKFWAKYKKIDKPSLEERVLNYKEVDRLLTKANPNVKKILLQYDTSRFLKEFPDRATNYIISSEQMIHTLQPLGWSVYCVPWGQPGRLGETHWAHYDEKWTKEWLLKILKKEGYYD